MNIIFCILLVHILLLVLLLLLLLILKLSTSYHKFVDFFFCFFLFAGTVRRFLENYSDVDIIVFVVENAEEVRALFRDHSRPYCIY